MIGKLLPMLGPRGRTLLRRMIAGVVVTAILQGLGFVALVPFLTALLEGDTDAAKPWLLALAAIGMLYAVAFVFSARAGNLAATEVIGDVYDVIGDRLVELPTGWFAKDRSGELAHLTTEGVVFVSVVPYAMLRPILSAFITPATVLIGAVFLDWRIALTMACAAPVIWFTYRWLGGRLSAAGADDAKAAADGAARVIEFARVQPALRAAADNSIATELVAKALESQHASKRRLYVTGGSGLAVFGSAVQLAVVAVIIVGTWLALGGDLAVASLVPLLVLAVRFTEPITHSGALGGGLKMAENSLNHVQRLLDEATLPQPATPRVPEDHTVRFDNVTFGYGGAPVLRELSFEASAGQMTAIVGPSGSGKTTITRLIARFYDPESGTVSIGDVPLPAIGSQQVTRTVAPVFQDVYLFDGTIFDNIQIGNPDASRDDVLVAAGQARVDEIADRLPDGWDSRVGEGGTNLSGGERQRVSIARALLKDAPIVLLDEATAALDVENEQAIGDAFGAIRAGRTLVVVAHRMQTIAAADRIVMLDGHGGIAEQGTHAELLDTGGPYARYWSERTSAAGWRLAPS